MSLINDLSGIITVINTPFNTDLTIDEASLCRNVEYIIKAGCKGILVPAMASEVSKLTLEEHIRLVDIVNKSVKQRICVIAGTARISFDEALKLCEIFSKKGLPILVNLDFSDEKTFLSQLQQIDAFHPKFLMLQDWSPTDYGIPVKVIKRAFETIRSFQSYKIEVVHSCFKYSEILNITDGKLHLAGGWAVSQMLEGLHRGVHSFMPTGMHEIYVTIYDSFKYNKHYAEYLINKISPVLSFSNQHLDISIHFFKFLLYFQGIYSTPLVREPILSFDEISQNYAKKYSIRILDIIDDIKFLNLQKIITNF